MAQIGRERKEGALIIRPEENLLGLSPKTIADLHALSRPNNSPLLPAIREEKRKLPFIEPERIDEFNLSGNGVDLNQSVELQGKDTNSLKPLSPKERIQGQIANRKPSNQVDRKQPKPAVVRRLHP